MKNIVAAIRGAHPQEGEAAGRRADRTLGVIVALITVVALSISGYLYFRPPAQQDLVFEVTDASAIKDGQNVRVAGIGVGKVTGTEIEKSTVLVRARIDKSVHIGDASRLEVRMLTAVGGYAITLIPHGEKAAPGGRIPKERVKVPYSVADVLQVAPRVTDDVKSTTVRANLLQLGEALDDQPNAIRSVADGLQSVATVLDEQRQQVRDVASLAREYMTEVNGSRDFVFTLIGKIDRVVTTYRVTSAGFNRAFDLFGDVLGRLAPLEKFYLERADAIGGHVEYLRNLIAQAQTQIGPAIDNLLGLRGTLMNWANPDGTGPSATPWTGGICIPLQGQEC